ncbi:F-box domain-containing protein [Mycena venus]|uniref:F-box domain-containing protein n=1 Tax=Mycena venus TaxID=2733690 RepID=A0A8H6YTU1_9AGAR|nr:F-box domain-containing protein [Mycena venus]
MENAWSVASLEEEPSNGFGTGKMAAGRDRSPGPDRVCFTTFLLNVHRRSPSQTSILGLARGAPVLHYAVSCTNNSGGPPSTPLSVTAMAESSHTCPNCRTAFDASMPPLQPTLVSNDILETNNPPLESQIPFLRDFISSGRARMAILNAKTAFLQSELDKLRLESDALDVEICKHQGGLSPLRRMPTEILSLIFTFTLPPHPRAESAPWTISAVCSRWRAIVISQPCFWSFIQLDYHSEFSPITSFRLETQLRRSGELPLKIEILMDNIPFRSWESFKLRILCEHAERWEKISIEGSAELCEHLGYYIPDRLPLLRELTIELEFDDDGPDVSLDMFSDAPQLQQVVANKKNWFYPIAMVLPWSQMLRYGGSNTWDGHLHSLHNATNLVDCSLEISGSSFLPSTPIVLPHLLRLSLSHAEFLGSLATPALLELYCDYAPAVLPFLNRQTCKLRKLVMWECSTPADDADLTRIVDLVPTITNLAFPFRLPVSFARDFCSRLDMAPALECFSSSLDIPNDYPSGEDYAVFQDQFMQAIESRWQNGRLKSFKVAGRTFAPGILDRVKLLQSQGMEIVTFLQWYSVLSDVIPPELYIESED